MKLLYCSFLIILTISLNLYAQTGESPIKTFGYFQTSFTHIDDLDRTGNNYFSIQQLNLIFQKDIAKNWTSFVGLEFLNTFSSGKDWGEANLEEAWIRYHAGKRLNIKIGLQIPTFNNLNEINNRTPILPYVTRPLAYESSFNEFISVEEFVPQRTFLQAYGFFPINSFKLEYAVYIGNSPNISRRSDDGPSGIDTTDTFLLGGRIGIKDNNLKLGMSSTIDKKENYYTNKGFTNLKEFGFDYLTRNRLGADLSYRFGGLSLESEYIYVDYRENDPEFSLDKEFWYATLGYEFLDELFVYISYYYSKENFLHTNPDYWNLSVKIKVPTVGLAYDFNYRIRFKLQFAPVEVRTKNRPEENLDWNYFAGAVSVFF
ncbi:hypothetical protein ACFLS9_09175, partial [Bacteroidota bacterium]